jgi:hypothetical protein
LAALDELDIDCRFEQADGARNNAGHYRIASWGPIDPRWIESQLARIKHALDYP